MGGEPVHMRERYFLARVYGTATITRVHLEPSEQQGIIGHRWWSLAELLEVETPEKTLRPVVRPSYFVDEQVSGPFRYWRHAHTFESTRDGEGGVEATLMKDIVEFAAPAGPLGILAEVLVLRRYMTKLILMRNAHIKRTIETTMR